MEFTLSEIIEATGAEILKNEGVDGLKFTFSTDTRTIKEGQIYLPLKGENFDGEKFIDNALEAGAIGYFTSGTSDGTGKASIIFQVEDTLTAYLQLARFYKRKINPKTIAITGSCGKTTTKEMAYCVASESFKTHKSELNFNNEIGLCKTILSMPEDTQVLILEMGMRGLGQIELLSRYAEPDIAIIANVGTAHIGLLGSAENIAKAKCEIVKYLKPDGILIAHDNEIIKNILVKQLTSPSVHLKYFSFNQAKINERNVGYTKFNYKNHEYELNIEGDYNVQNSIPVIEMGFSLGMSEDEIASGLKKYSPIEKRWEVQDVKWFKVINDSYNANPDSMIAVIKTVLDIYSPPILFVLGDMGELGENEAFYHAQIGEVLKDKIKNGVEVVTVGNLANEISKKLNDAGIESKNFENNLQTSRYILDNVKIGTTIVLKASRSGKFEQILNEIIKEQ